MDLEVLIPMKKFPRPLKVKCSCTKKGTVEAQVLIILVRACEGPSAALQVRSHHGPRIFNLVSAIPAPSGDLALFTQSYAWSRLKFGQSKTCPLTPRRGCLCVTG